MARILFAPEPQSYKSILRMKRVGAISISPQDFEKLLKGEIKFSPDEVHVNFQFRGISCETNVEYGKGTIPGDVLIFGSSETMFPRSYEAEAVPIISVEFLDAEDDYDEDDYDYEEEHS